MGDIGGWHPAWACSKGMLVHEDAWPVDSFCSHLQRRGSLISYGRISADLVVRAADRAWGRAALVEWAREALEASELSQGVAN
jgi:hypothetical protein